MVTDVTEPGLTCTLPLYCCLPRCMMYNVTTSRADAVLRPVELLAGEHGRLLLVLLSFVAYCTGCPHCCVSGTNALRLNERKVVDITSHTPHESKLIFTVQHVSASGFSISRSRCHIVYITRTSFCLKSDVWDQFFSLLQAKTEILHGTFLFPVAFLSTSSDDCN